MPTLPKSPQNRALDTHLRINVGLPKCPTDCTMLVSARPLSPPEETTAPKPTLGAAANQGWARAACNPFARVLHACTQHARAAKSVKLRVKGGVFDPYWHAACSCTSQFGLHACKHVQSSDLHVPTTAANNERC